MLVGCQSLTDPTIHCTSYRGFVSRFVRHAHVTMDLLPLRCYPHRKATAGWTGWWFPWSLRRSIARLNPDIVHLHWVGSFVSAQEVPRIGRPIVWTMHDMGEFTGGCRFTSDCTRFHERCGCCPQLASAKVNDLSRRTLDCKLRLWNSANITPVATSAWMQGLAQASAVFANRKIRRIPIGIPTEIFLPVPVETARSHLGLPLDAVVILFGAASLNDPRKGFHLLLGALAALPPSSQQRLHLLAFGGGNSLALQDLPIPVRTLGYLRDENALRVAYSAADAYVLPSLMDTLPSTVLESLACGTPPIVCAGSGVVDAVQDGVSGFVAPEPTVPALTAAIERMLSMNDTARLTMRTACRQRAETEYPEARQARQYLSLYHELLSQTRKNQSSSTAATESTRRPS